LNNSLLQDKSFNDQLTATLIGLKDYYKNTEDKRFVWEIIKYEIRKFCITFSKYKSNLRRCREKDLEKQLINLERKTLDDILLQEVENIKSELKLIEKNKIEGMIIRSKVQWYEEGEMSSKYFLSLEKNHAVRKHIRRLTLQDGSSTTDPVQILQLQKQFYENLYKNGVNEQAIYTNTERKFLEDSNIPVLSEDSKYLCEGAITIQECEKILTTFKKNKSPGNDGLTYEFYIQFWDAIKDVFVSCLNYAFIKGELSTSQKQAVISLIDKKGKDKLLLKNWRPISLLNCDYKIASKVIAARIKQVLPKLVHTDQSGFVDGRNLSSSLRTVLDIIDITNYEKLNGLLIFVDFEKAFDTVNHNFLFNVLERYNFGPDFIQWIKTFYKDIVSCVINNNVSSEYIKIERGVRQGDPLSPYLFVIVAEILSVNIRSDNLIKGIQCNTQEVKLTQYADDTTGIFADLPSAKQFLKIVEMFSLCSGLRLNIDKTEGMWLGKDKTKTLTPLGINWPSGPIKLLGLYIGHNEKDMEVSNFRHKINKVKQLLHAWSDRDLSLIGRILIVKSLAFSQFTNLANLIIFPKHIITELEEIIYKFIWRGKTHKVKKNVLIQDYGSGGCKMEDFQSTLQASQVNWVKRYLSNENGAWKFTMEKCIGVKNLNILLRGNFDASLISHCTTFYKSVLHNWNNIKYNPVKNNDFSNVFIYYNKHICLNKKMIYSKHLLEAGIW